MSNVRRSIGSFVLIIIAPSLIVLAEYLDILKRSKFVRQTGSYRIASEKEGGSYKGKYQIILTNNFIIPVASLLVINVGGQVLKKY